MTIKYSVISAVYNVSKYLNDYFNSLVNQSIGLKNNIELILVDDGSIDHSAEIIKKWQQRYPNNIHYYYKENGGQASARNLGLQYAKGKWVTFIDPDDFVALDYFAETDKAIRRNDYVFIANKLVFYYEDSAKYSDSHPLTFKFTDKEISLAKIERNVQLAVHSAFFLRTILVISSIKFDIRIKPNFEDGAFIANYLSYLLKQKNGLAFYNSNAQYFYRKRADKSSTLDNTFYDIRRYSDLLEFGYLASLEDSAAKNGIVPKWLQFAVMYDLLWQFKAIINNNHKFYFLTALQKNRYINLCKQIFAYIDKTNVVCYNLANTWFFYKIGILNLLKNERPTFNIFYVENIDKQRKLLNVRFFHATPNLKYAFAIDACPVQAVNKNIKRVDFFGETFIYEYHIDLYIPNLKGVLSYQSEYSSTRLSFQGKHYKESLSLEKHVAPYIKRLEIRNEFAGAWLVMDRDIVADDNAEHFYRYLMQQNISVDAYFVLRRTSRDWNRLAEEGFRLIEFGSPEHEKALLACSKLISSHADQYIFEPIEGKKIKPNCSYHYVFLQHGITKDDLSNWLNSKHIQLFVTVTKPEYSSIAGEGSPYKFTDFNVKRTGFPRHDALLKKAQSIEEGRKRRLLIMPTWRRELLGTALGIGCAHEVLFEFFDSFYFKYWNGFLCSDYLRACAEKVEIVFFPHMNIQPYLAQWPLPEYIQICTNSGQDASFQDVLVTGSIMVTDYSSVAFDFVYLRRPVIYFQFDRETVFNGAHTYKKGYFDYDQDGLGPVALDQTALETALQNIIANNYQLDPLYRKRIDTLYDLEPGKNCERVYQEILNLDNPPWLQQQKEATNKQLLDELLARKKMLGKIGALDFLIEREKRKLVRKKSESLT